MYNRYRAFYYIRQKAGEEIVPACVLDLRDFPGDVMEDKVVRDIREITENPEISVVVETMGGTRFAYPYVKACLEAGKHVATSNKALVAAYGDELLRIAAEKNVQFLFEASVGGGIPIIRALTDSVTADPVKEVFGILNGTTNYILTQMGEGCGYGEALKEAQKLGFAEQDPSADVEGYDACRKIAILSSLAFGRFVSYEDVPTVGITGITGEDIRYADALGMKIKLLGRTSRDAEGGVSAGVEPMLVAKENPLYSVDGVMNAVLVRGSAMGEYMFYGPGAGKLPTACAVVEDVITAVRSRDVPEIRPFPEERQVLAGRGEIKERFLVRLKDGDSSSAEDFRKACGAAKTLSGIAEGECAVVTGEIAGKDFLRLAENPAVIGYLRIAD